MLQLTAGMLYVWYMAAVRQIGFAKETTIPHIWGAIIYMLTKFHGNSLIGDRDMPENEI